MTYVGKKTMRMAIVDRIEDAALSYSHAYWAGSGKVTVMTPKRRPMSAPIDTYNEMSEPSCSAKFFAVFSVAMACVLVTANATPTMATTSTMPIIKDIAMSRFCALFA